MRRTLLWLPLALPLFLLGTTQAALATFMFSDVVITPNSVAFTINGNMDLYAAPSDGNIDMFSIVYRSGVWSGPVRTTSNQWSGSVFANETMSAQGYSGGFGTQPNNFTWVRFDTSLANAWAINRRVSVTLADAYLDPNASSGSVDFVWGHGGQDTNFTLLGSVVVPEPSTCPLVAVGLVGVGLGRRPHRGHPRSRAT